ncbi:MAG: hypothetical protein JWO82_2191 [Akkermansiaceae bacterium]|nr:hypothetical protein [Akkermansiaceae bacterium]
MVAGHAAVGGGDILAVTAIVDGAAAPEELTISTAADRAAQGAVQAAAASEVANEGEHRDEDGGDAEPRGPGPRGKRTGRDGGHEGGRESPRRAPPQAGMPGDEESGAVEGGGGWRQTDGRADQWNYFRERERL